MTLSKKALEDFMSQTGVIKVDSTKLTIAKMFFNWLNEEVCCPDCDGEGGFYGECPPVEYPIVPYSECNRCNESGQIPRYELYEVES